MSLSQEEITKINDLQTQLRNMCEGEASHVAGWLDIMAENSTCDESIDMDLVIVSLEELIDAAKFAIEELKK